MGAFHAITARGWEFSFEQESLEASNRAIQAAARVRRPLLVVRDAALASCEAVGMLLEMLASDPLFGFAVARTANVEGLLGKLQSDLGDRDIDSLPRSVLAALQPYYIVPEVVGRCFIVRAELLANLGTLDLGFQTTVGAWLHYLCRARRLGFRGVIVNQAVVPLIGEALSATLPPCANDYWRLHRQFPDTAYARREFDLLPAHEYETLLGRARCTKTLKRKTLLLDARGMASHHNGTSSCILGLLDGFAVAASDWDISVLVRPEANAFHKVSARYPSWNILEELSETRFSIALRLDQPWDGRTIKELHRHALYNFFLMLDTISWDILYNGATPQTVDAAWRFLAEYSDGLLFISDFSRQRYNNRFAPSSLVRQYVSYLSFNPSDYFKNGRPADDGDYLLVVGNHLDHKWVTPTVELLATAFPFENVRALGCAEVQIPNVARVPSGDRSDEEIVALYRGARIVVFPSFYEGFGFPVLQGLSCGKAVIARRSTLLDEIAARSRADGRLYAFSDPGELLEIIGCLLKGNDCNDLSLATALGQAEAPERWPDIAGGILDFVSSSFEGSGEQWMRRMHNIELHECW